MKTRHFAKGTGMIWAAEELGAKMQKTCVILWAAPSASHGQM